MKSFLETVLVYQDSDASKSWGVSVQCVMDIKASLEKAVHLE